MDKSQVKKTIIIVVLAIILYGLLWISLVGLATLIFNTISHNKTNWFLNSNLFVIATVIWLIIVGAFGYNYILIIFYAYSESDSCIIYVYEKN